MDPSGRQMDTRRAIVAACDGEDVEADAALVDRLAATSRRACSRGEFASGARLRQESLAASSASAGRRCARRCASSRPPGSCSSSRTAAPSSAGPSAREVREAYEVRAELEGLAAELARDADPRRGPAPPARRRGSVPALVDDAPRLDGRAAAASPPLAHAELDRGNDLFHLVILEAAGNQRLRATLADLHRASRAT